MKENLKEKSYKYIKNKIVTCEYPPGFFLDEKVLIEEIGASRTPIREALNKLEQEELLQILPKKGVVVTEITLKSIVDIFQVRVTLELDAFERFWDNINLDFINELKEECMHFNVDTDVTVHDDKFHDYILSLYDNKYINSLDKLMESQLQRHRVITTNKSMGCYEDTKNEHLEIFNNILKNDKETAKEALRYHLNKSQDRTISALLKLS
ncbi:MAG: GntR family transcriptional regulator [Lachnospirales bacterium]